MQTSDPAFGIRIHRPVPARVLRAHTRRMLSLIFLILLTSALITAVFVVKSTLQGQRSLGAGFEMLMGAGLFGALTFAVGVGWIISRIRIRRSLATGIGLEVIVSENVLKLTQPNQPPHYLLRRDVQLVLDLGNQLNLVHGERQTLVSASLEDWDELRSRLRTWGPVETRSLRATRLWAMTPLATLLLSALAWVIQDPAFAALISIAAVILGVALAFRIGTSRILPTKQKLLGLIRALVFTLGALGRIALFVEQFANGNDLFDPQPSRSRSHQGR